MSDYEWLRTAICKAAGCDHEAYASRNRHAPNCLQADVNLVLDELEAKLARHATNYVSRPEDEVRIPRVDD